MCDKNDGNKKMYDTYPVPTAFFAGIYYGQEYHSVGRRYIVMARMPASRNTFSKPPNSQTKEL